MPASPKIRVLIVDDSAIVRKILSEALASEPDIEVVGTAPDPIVAFEKIERLRPDVLTVDIEMPRMDGLTFLKKLMQTHPLPVILISSLAQSSCEIALAGLKLGAVDVLAKPNGPYSVGDLRASVVGRVRAAARAKLRQPQVGGTVIAVPPTPPPAGMPSTPRKFVHVVAIGASTGGVEAITTVLTALPAEVPPILITQHIPAVFSKAFAERLNKLCRMEVREAKDGDEVKPGLALVAPGGFHMVLSRPGNRVTVRDGPLVCYQRPSVDVMFASVADAVGGQAIGVILTGMGADGAKGLLAMRQKGARTMAQDEASCVVFGMPGAAVKVGAAEQVLPLQDVAAALMRAAS